MLRRERVAPQFEVIRAIFLEDSSCCGVPHPCQLYRASSAVLKSTQAEVIRAILMSMERISPQTEVIWGVVLEDSPCYGGARTVSPTTGPLMEVCRMSTVFRFFGSACMEGTQPEVIRAI